jgi:hypothetical protein
VACLPGAGACVRPDNQAIFSEFFQYQESA